jgi:hypothetical protein
MALLEVESISKTSLTDREWIVRESRERLRPFGDQGQVKRMLYLREMTPRSSSSFKP